VDGGDVMQSVLSRLFFPSFLAIQKSDRWKMQLTWETVKTQFGAFIIIIIGFNLFCSPFFLNQRCTQPTMMECHAGHHAPQERTKPLQSKRCIQAIAQLF
jgi:hypothetical protein